jgi:predicted CoA-binding protein
MSDRIDAFLAARSAAVIGASSDRSKYGNIILRNLRERGWEVFAVNPKGTPIEGAPAYRTPAECPSRPGLAVMVTPPEATMAALDAVKAAGIAKVWFQDGSWTPEVLEKAQALGLDEVHDACIMVAAAARR